MRWVVCAVVAQEQRVRGEGATHLQRASPPGTVRARAGSRNITGHFRAVGPQPHPADLLWEFEVLVAVDRDAVHVDCEESAFADGPDGVHVAVVRDHEVLAVRVLRV